MAKTPERQQTEHPYITSTPGVCGGEPRIKGHRIPVWLIAAWHIKLGYDAEEIQQIYPQLTLAEIYDAFSYYYDHLDEIDQAIGLQMDEEYWKKQIPSKLLEKYGVRQ